MVEFDIRKKSQVNKKMATIPPFKFCLKALENGYGVGMGMGAIDRTVGQGTLNRSEKGEEQDEEEDNLSSGQTEKEEEYGEERSIGQKEEE